VFRAGSATATESGGHGIWGGGGGAGKELGEVAKRGNDCCLLFFFLDCGPQVMSRKVFYTFFCRIKVDKNTEMFF
jgi:hypothetical protein